MELEDIEKDTAKIISYKTKSERIINGIRHRFEKGDILYSKLRTYLNKVLVAPNNGYCTTEIIPIKSTAFLSDFLCLVLRSPYFLEYTAMCGYGVKMPRLSTTDAKKAIIPVPPINEQKRIIIEIQKWFSIVDLLEQNNSDLRTTIQQAKSKILDLAIHGKLVSQDPADEPAIELLKRINPDFVPADNSHYGQLPNGWVTSRLNKIAQILTGNTPSKNHKEYYGNEIPFYKPTDLEQGRYMKYASEYLSALGGTMTRIVPENSVAICCIGSIGKCAYVMQTGATNQQINTIITSKAVLPLYLYYLCCSTTFITLLNSESSAITISIVNKSKLGNIPIPIPPYKEQLRIVEQIEKQYAILDSITAEL